MPSLNVTTSVLTIPNVTSEDVGIYYCVAWANLLAAQSQSANLFLAGKLSAVLHTFVYCMLYTYM